VSERFQSRTKSFTRRARALPDNLLRTMDSYGDRFVLAIDRAEGHTTVAEDFDFDPENVFGRTAPLVVEIGSGVGEQIVAAAAGDPARDFLAFEVWQPGIAKAVSRAVEAEEERGARITNLRILEADAQQAFPIVFGDGSISELWTFFPDPWRKARHHKRRLVSASFIPEIARVLKPGAPWRLATDWEDYAQQMWSVLSASDLFQAEKTSRWDGRVLTRFEKRGIDAGRETWDFTAWRV